MNNRQKNVAQYCNGLLSSREIASLCGDNQKYVQSVMLKFDLPRRSIGSASGSENGSWSGGRRIDRDGYVLVSSPKKHPYARTRKDRHTGIIFEHRLMMEDILGRYLLPEEVVDHIDGLRLHNEPDNLRLFSSNSEHLKATITGQVPCWSYSGIEKQSLKTLQRINSPRIDTYNQMKKNGDARLRQIFLIALKFGEDSPFLLGSCHHLKKAGISSLDRSSLERELMALYRKYELTQTRL